MLETKHKSFPKHVFKKVTKFSGLCDRRAYLPTCPQLQIAASASHKNVYKSTFSNKMTDGKGQTILSQRLVLVTLLGSNPATCHMGNQGVFLQTEQ